MKASQQSRARSSTEERLALTQETSGQHRAGLPFHQFVAILVTLWTILLWIIAGTHKIDQRLQAIQEILEEQWTLMDSSAYEEIDRYKDMPEGELFEAEEF